MRACVLLALLGGCTADNAQQTGDGGEGDLSGSVDDLSAAADLSAGGAVDGPPAGPDLAMPQDLRGFDLAGVFVCGSNLCGSGQTCCVTSGGGMANGSCLAGACGDAGVPVSCGGPTDCMGDPCCLTVQNSLPTQVVCTNMANACVPSFNLATKSGTTRICRNDADCTSGGVTTSYGTCCTMVDNGQHLCFNSTIAGLTSGKGKITCP